MTFDVADDTRMRFYEESATRFVLDVDLEGVFVEAIDPLTLARAAEAAAPAGADTGAGTAEDEDIADVPVTEETIIVPFVTTVGPTVRVVFPFTSETPAAVFRRGETLWLVFDTRARIDAPSDDHASGALEALVSGFAVEGTAGPAWCGCR